jgi:hypothetical protein
MGALQPENTLVHGDLQTLAGPTLRVTVTLLLLAASAPLCITFLATQLTPALRVCMESKVISVSLRS